jgi:hypothetical protein
MCHHYAKPVVFFTGAGGNFSCGENRLRDMTRRRWYFNICGGTRSAARVDIPGFSRAERTVSTSFQRR